MDINRSIRFLIPNIFTGLRLLLVVPIFLAALHGTWPLGFWLLAIALVSDFLDGLAAKLLNAYSRLGAQLDSLADFFLAAAGIAGIIFSGHFPLWAGCIMLALALWVGYIKFLSKNSTLRQLQPMFSVPYLFMAWIFIALVYASQAYGWSWWYVAITLGVLAVAAAFKRHRLRVWYAWLLRRGAKH